MTTQTYAVRETYDPDARTLRVDLQLDGQRGDGYTVQYPDPAEEFGHPMITFDAERRSMPLAYPRYIATKRALLFQARGPVGTVDTLRLVDFV